ncbi:nucleotidyltransferase domain-containing protein, partial [Nanoarchaeota archaeon NZ13-N]
MEETLKLIKETILNVAKEYNVEIDKIILFGSRARGDFRENSDWD